MAMSTRLYGQEAIDAARAQEADDILVRNANGEWRWASLDDAIEAHWRAEHAADQPAPCVVMFDLEDDR